MVSSQTSRAAKRGGKVGQSLLFAPGPAQPLGGPANQSRIGKYVNWEFAHPLYKFAEKYKLQEIKFMEINAI